MPETQTRSKMSRCWAILKEEAERYGVPPAIIVSHYGSPRKEADKARRVIWKRIIDETGMRRHELSYLFGRDLRRVRYSVIKGGGHLLGPRDPRGGASWWPRKPRPIPVVEVRSQFIWKFGEPDEKLPDHPPIARFMRPLPPGFSRQLLPSEKLRLETFYQNQIRMLASSI